MSSWFGDGFTSLKGQLSSLAKALAEEPQSTLSGAESSPIGSHSETHVEDDKNKGGETSSDCAGDGGSGWTDVQLIHPSSEEEVFEKEVPEEVKVVKAANQKEKLVKVPESSSSEIEKDVGSIIRGGIANLFQISREPESSNATSKDGSLVPLRDQQIQTEYNQELSAALVDSLQDRIDQLTQQNESLLMNVASLGRAAAELEAQVAVSQDENANLSTGLEELDIQHQRAIESVMVVRDETQREYEVLKVRYAQLEDELKNTKEREKEKEKAKGKEKGRELELVKELEKRDGELECLESENASLRESLRDMKKEQEENSKETLATISEHDGEELEALERQVELLSKQLTQATALRKEKDCKMDELNNKLHTLVCEVDSFKQCKEQSKKEESDYLLQEEKNDKLEKQLADLEAKLTLAVNAKIESESLIEHLQSQLECSNKSNLESIDISSETLEKINSLEEQNLILHTKSGLLESRLLELSDQKDHFQKECDSKDRRMCQILLESNAAEQECKKELEIQEIKYSQLIEEFNSFKVSSENEIEQKEFEIKKLISRIEANNEIIVDSAMNTEMNEKCSLLEQENENLMTESGKMKLENKDLMFKIRGLNEQIEKADRDLSNAKNEVLILKKQCEFDVRSMESKLNECSMASQQYQIDKEVFNQKEIELKNQLKIKDEEISAFKTFKQQSEITFKEKVASIETEYNQIIQEKENRLEMLSGLKTEVDSLKTSLESNSKLFEDQIKIKDAELEKIKGNLERALKEKECVTLEVSRLQQDYDSFTAEKSQHNVEQQEKERETFLRKIESITEQNAQLLSDIIRLNAEHAAKKNQLILSHNEETTNLKNNLSIMQVELKSTQERIATECEELKNKLTQAESDRDELFKNIQLKHNECIGFQTEVLRLNELFKTEQTKMEALVVDKAQLEMKCEKLMSVEKEREASKKEVTELTQEVNRLKEQLDNASELLKETKRTEAEGQSAEDNTSTKLFKCLEGCEKTQEKLNKLSWALHNEQMNNKSMQRQFADVKDKFEKSEVQLRRLQVHLVEVEQNQTEEQVEVRDQMEQMKAKLDVAEDRLRQSSTAFTSANIRANQQVESLTHQVQMMTENKERMEAELSSAEDSVLKQQAAVTNLQAVLHQFQQDKQKDIEFETERLRQQLKDSHDKNENLNCEMRKTIDQMNEMKKGLDAASRLSEQLDKKAQVIENLKSEVTVLKEKLEKEKEKVSEIHSSVEGKVDRNLVKNLVIGYMLADEKSKSQVQRVLASVLELDSDERKKLSLEPQSQKQQQSLSEAFIKFLENESQPKPQLVLSVPPTPDGSASRRTSQSSNSSVLLSAEASSLSHSPVIPPYPVRSNHSILKDLLKDNSPAGSGTS